MIKSSTFKRNPDRIKNVTYVKDNKLYTKEPLRIYAPVRYMDRELMFINEKVIVLGIIALMTEDKQYGVLSVTTVVELLPNEIQKVTIDDDEYMEFHFDKGDVVIPNLDVVVSDNYIFEIFNEFIIKGKVPWYLNYDDIGKIFSTSKKYSGSNVGKSSEAVELIASVIARDPKDRMTYYRRVVKDRQYLRNNPPEFVPLQSVFYSVSNTTAKLIGSYFSDGIVSSLVEPADKVENIEKILRQ